MLPLKYLIADYDLAMRASSNWPHDADTLQEDVQRCRISSNAVHVFHFEGNRRFVRLAPAHLRDIDALEAEIAWLSRLEANGIPAVRVVETAEGKDWVQVPNGETPWLAVAFEGVPGTALDRMDCGPEHIRSYARSLARLHDNCLPEVSRPTRLTDADVLQEISTALQALAAPSSAFAELNEVRELLAAIPPHEPRGLVHYDFELDNVFYDQATDECWPIDFDDSLVSWLAMDVEQALDAMDDLNYAEGAEAARELFLSTYRVLQPMVDTSEKMRHTMRRFVNLRKYARLQVSLNQLPEVQPDWMPALITRLEGIVATLEESFAR